MELSESESLRKVAKGTAVAFFGLLVFIILEFVARIIIIRNTTQSEYGAFCIGIVILNFFAVAACLGLQGGAPRCIAYFRGRGDDRRVSAVIRSTLKLSVLASLLCSLLLFLSADFLTALFHFQPQETAVLRAFALAVPFFVAIEILAPVFMGFDRVQERVYFREVLMNVLKVSFVAGAVLLGCSLLGLVCAYVFSIVVASVAFAFYAVKKLPLKCATAEAVPATVTKGLLRFSLPLLVTYVLGVAVLQTATLMLGYFKTTAVVGLYNAAHTVAVLITVFIISLAFIYIPIASQLYSRGLMNEIRRNYAVLTKWVFSAAFPSSLFLFLFPKPVLNVLFGSAYESASLALQILALGFFFTFFLGPNAATLVVVGRTKLNMLDDLVGAVTNLSLNALLIPVFGIVGAAVATAISLAALTLLKSVQIYRIHKIHPFATNYLKPVVIYCVLVSVVYAVVNIFWSERVTFGILIVLSFLFLVMYGLSILITKSFEREDEIILEEVERILGVDASRIKSMLRRFL